MTDKTKPVPGAKPLTAEDVVAMYKAGRRDFTHLNLSGLQLEEVCLRNSNFAGCEMVKTDLSHADLEGCNLTASNLQRANLEGAYLRDTALFATDLRGACLEDIQFATAPQLVEASGLELVCSPVPNVLVMALMLQLEHERKQERLEERRNFADAAGVRVTG